jgi:hypothetical protein
MPSGESALGAVCCSLEATPQFQFADDVEDECLILLPFQLHLRDFVRELL